MPAVASSHPPAPPQARSLAAIVRWEPLFAATAVVIALSMLLSVPALLLDGRVFQGDNVWVKPLKFQVALVVYLLTLAAYARWLPEGMTRRRSYRLFAGAVVLAAVAELLWVGGAAVFGIASHYNTSNPFMARLYPVMGVLAILLTSASLVYGIAIARNGRTGLRPSLHVAIALGLVLTFVLTVPTAGILSAMPGHGVGLSGEGARVPVLGWSRVAGDLRAPHFLATHALHILPVAGLMLSAVATERMARVGVWLAGLALTGFVILAVVLALGGRPLIP